MRPIKDVKEGESKSGTRRRFLAFGAALSGVLGSCKKPESADEAPRLLGEPTREYGSRSVYEKASRHLRTTRTPEAASSRTPLADSHGIITPSALHFERHHAGVPNQGLESDPRWMGECGRRIAGFDGPARALAKG